MTADSFLQAAGRGNNLHRDAPAANGFVLVTVLLPVLESLRNFAVLGRMF
jgi:hypothetical protein